MIQQTLINNIKEALLPGASLNETLAEILDISYDAAHRRVTGKSKITIEEGLLIAKHFHMSLDALMALQHPNLIVVEKTLPINSATDLELYFKQSHESLETLSKMEGAEMIYSAKDIPLFYTLDDGLLSRFKMYVWLKLSDTKKQIKDTQFEQFAPPLSLLQAATELKGIYKAIKSIEIWNDTTFDSTMKQIRYFYQTQDISKDSALLLCEALKEMLDTIEERSVEELELYSNDLLILNNNVLVRVENRHLVFTPYSMLGYFKVEDQITTDRIAAYFDKQLKSSTSLSMAGERDRKMFFNKIHRKIDSLSNWLQSDYFFEL